jgi:hypothetical protein
MRPDDSEPIFDEEANKSPYGQAAQEFIQTTGEGQTNVGPKPGTACPECGRPMPCPEGHQSN